MESNNTLKSIGNGINFTTHTTTDLDMALVCPVSSCKYDVHSLYNSNIPNITTNSLRYNHLITPVVPMQFCSEKVKYRSISPSSSKPDSKHHSDNYQQVNANFLTVNNSSSNIKSVIKSNTPLTQTNSLSSTAILYNTGITPIIRIDGKCKSLKRKWNRQKELNTSTNLVIANSKSQHNHISCSKPKTNISAVYEIIDVSDSDSDEYIVQNSTNHTEDIHKRKRKRKIEMNNHFPIINTNM